METYPNLDNPYEEMAMLELLFNAFAAFAVVAVVAEVADVAVVARVAQLAVPNVEPVCGPLKNDELNDELAQEAEMLYDSPEITPPTAGAQEELIAQLDVIIIGSTLDELILEAESK